ncbi:MAG: hypothetical protein ACRDYA_11245 [Egibacteraceae bacterium]
MPVRVALTPPLQVSCRSAAGQLQVTGVAAFGKQPTEPDVAVLRSQLDEAVRLYRDDRYEATALLLPEMIAAAHATVACYDHGDERIEALHLALGCAPAGGMVSHLGGGVRSGLSGARGRDRRRERGRGSVGSGRPGRAAPVEGAGRRAVRVGWLLLRGWAATVRNNQEPEALEMLRVAQAAAAGVGEET